MQACRLNISLSSSIEIQQNGSIHPQTENTLVPLFVFKLEHPGGGLQENYILHCNMTRMKNQGVVRLSFQLD